MPIFLKREICCLQRRPELADSPIAAVLDRAAEASRSAGSARGDLRRCNSKDAKTPRFCRRSIRSIRTTPAPISKSPSSLPPCGNIRARRRCTKSPSTRALVDRRPQRAGPALHAKRRRRPRPHRAERRPRARSVQPRDDQLSAAARHDGQASPARRATISSSCTMPKLDPVIPEYFSEYLESVHASICDTFKL